MLIASNPARTGLSAPIAALLVMLVPAILFPGTVEPRTAPVSLYLNVETNGSLVTGLKAGNLRLYEDGEWRPFFLAPVEEPASIAVLVEYSRSSGAFLEEIDAAIQGIHANAPESHWYALATFSHNLDIVTDFTNQPGALAAAWANRGLPVWSEIDTYDAVFEMVDKLGRLPGRRILLLIGSGLDTFSEHTLDDVRRKLESENVTVFAAGLGSEFRTRYEPWLGSSSRMNLLRAQAFLRMLAERSGGFAWFPSYPQGFPSAVAGMFQSVSAQYRLIYNTSAPGSGKFHPISVDAFRVVDDRRENFKVLVRRGWR